MNATIAWAATSLTLLGGVLSAIFYRHGGRRYAVGKVGRIPSLRYFRYIYRYLQISSVVVAAASFWSDHSALLKLYTNDWATIAGMMVGLIGLGVFIWAKMSLGGAYSPCFDALLPQGIVIRGPYRFVRHPIYSGNIVLLIGLFVASGSLWIAANAIILACCYYSAALTEEQSLKNQFPEYAELVSRTGRFLPTKGKR